MNSNNPANKNQYLTGFGKFIFFQHFKAYIFLKYSRRLLAGEIIPAQFFLFLRRILLLYGIMKVNKVVKTRGVYKIHLYLPAFPTQAFFIALDKFLVKNSTPSNLYPTSVLLSMGNTCNHRCPHCYQRLDTAAPMPLGKLLETARQIQDLKISFINIEGGEPMVDFERLAALLGVIDPDRSEVWVNSNGGLLTKERARIMKNLGVFGVMVSLHHWDRGKFDEFAGAAGAYDAAIAALRACGEAGLSTAINCTGTRELIESGGFEKIMQIAKDVNCAYVQLIHEKPAGAWIGREGTLRKDYVKKLANYHLVYSGHNEFKNYPAILSQAYESLEENLGCTAGGIERFYINASGEVQPCEFVNVTFGNLNDEPFLEIYKRMRNFFCVPKTRWICCYESQKIKNAIEQSSRGKTPLPKDLSAKIIASFDLGKETPLYKKMKLYGK